MHVESISETIRACHVVLKQTHARHYALNRKMANNWQKVKEDLTCAVCQDLLNEPKTLPCLHSFCRGCLQEWYERLANLAPSKRHLECPLCRAKILLSTSRAVEELPSNFSAIRLVEIIRFQEQAETTKNTPICQNCDDEENAVSFCSPCAIFLCEFCEKSHKKSKATKQHKIDSFDDMRKGTNEVLSTLPEKVEMCPTHPTEPLELYCKCEEVLICRDCIIKKHKDHDYDVISDVVVGEKKILREALPGIQQLVDEVENAVNRIQGRRKDIESRKEENLKKLDNAFRALHVALDKHKQKIIEEINTDSKEKNKGLQVQEDELCFLLSQLKSCFSFIDNKVQRGVYQDVLAMKRSMLERRDKLTELKGRTKIYPIIRNQVPVNLNEMNEMKKLIPQLKYGY